MAVGVGNHNGPNDEVFQFAARGLYLRPIMYVM